MQASKFLMAVTVFGLAAAGCGGSDTVPPTGANQQFEPLDENGNFNSGVNTSAVDRSGLSDFEVMILDLPAAERELLQNLIVYFEFDSSEIRPEFNAMLAAHGRFLRNNPDWQVRLEGHADERGSREYNVGLGERRAQAVRQILQLQGSSNSQLTTVSYGEERPQVFGSDEAAYRENRRVELVYP